MTFYNFNLVNFFIFNFFARITVNFFLKKQVKLLKSVDLFEHMLFFSATKKCAVGLRREVLLQSLDFDGLKILCLESVVTLT